MTNQEHVKNEHLYRIEAKRDVVQHATAEWLERLVDLSHKLPVGHEIMVLSERGTWAETCNTALTDKVCATTTDADGATFKTHFNVGDIPRPILINLTYEMERHIAFSTANKYFGAEGAEPSNG